MKQLLPHAPHVWKTPLIGGAFTMMPVIKLVPSTVVVLVRIASTAILVCKTPMVLPQLP